MADVLAPPPAASGWDRLNPVSGFAARVWASFRRWPLLVQIVAWFLGFWLLIPVVIWRTGWSPWVKSITTVAFAVLMIASAATDSTRETKQPGPQVPVAVAPATTTSTTTTTITVPSHPVVTTPHHKHIVKKQPKPQHTPAKQPTGGLCPPLSHVLKGVYHPDRLFIIDRCKHAAGVVADIRSEEDGDYHIMLRLDPRFAYLSNKENKQQQHGWLVVEFMPRDHGHLPAPTIGQHIRFLGAWVLDEDHGWNEIHPVWQATMNGHTYSSGPWFGGSPVYSGSSDAIESCRTGSGKRCTAYGSTTSGGDSDSGGSGGGGGGGDCTPGYKPCLPPMSDYDCAGGEGNGPGYADYVQVTGSDPYGLDTDGDGVACET
jgi:uncharacterized membrane protein YgcG